MNLPFLRNLILKTCAWLALLSLLFAAIPGEALGQLSLYNRIFPGRPRFPFGENPAQSYNLSLFNISAMFAAHTISAAPKPATEYRIIIIGDSSSWGTLLRPEETLAGLLDSAGSTCNGKTVRVYNLGYPTISLTKDLMILDQAIEYQPDLVIWPLTLEAFPLDKQLSSPIVANNPARVRRLIEKYQLPLDPASPALTSPTWWDATIPGQRRALADLARLQLYGVLWSATGIDQAYPSNYEKAQTDLTADEKFHDQTPQQLDESQLSYAILEAGIRAMGQTSVLLINEPMLISTGKNSQIRYNFFYPRWAYDQYRQQMQARATQHGWEYLDLWDLVPATEFTNSAIHLTPAGEQMLAKEVQHHLLRSCP